MRWLLRGAVAALAVCAAPAGVRAHGFLADPAARNVQHNSNWCPSCLNAGGVDSVYSSGKQRFGLCGDPWLGPRHHEAYGKFATPTSIARRYKKNQRVTVRVELTANHMGRWSVRLCPLSRPSQGAERRELSQACLNAHLMHRADGTGPYTYVPSHEYLFSVEYRLPPNLTCRRCVMQWIYETGNTCAPKYAPREFVGTNLNTCGTPGAGAQELFVNCADVSVT